MSDRVFPKDICKRLDDIHELFALCKRLGLPYPDWPTKLASGGESRPANQRG